MADRFGRSDDPYSVAEREHHVVVRDEVLVTAPDPRHRHAVAADEIEVDEPFAGEPAVRHEDPPEIERRAVEWEMAVAALADVDAESLDLVRRPDHHQRVPGHGQVVVDRDRHHAVVADSAEADLVAIAQLTQRGQACRADRDRPVDEIGRLRRRWRRFERRRKAEPAADQQCEDEQHRHHRRRIGERVGDHGVALVDCLDRRLQRWRVRGTAGEQSGAFCRRESEPASDPADDGGERANERERDGDRADAAASETGEERRPGGETDRVREQHETELAEEGQPTGGTQRLVDRANGETDEQRGGRPDGDSPDPDASDGGTDADDQEREQDWLVREEVDHRAERRRGDPNGARLQPARTLGSSRGVNTATRPLVQPTKGRDMKPKVNAWKTSRRIAACVAVGVLAVSCGSDDHRDSRRTRRRRTRPASATVDTATVDTESSATEPTTADEPDSTEASDSTSEHQRRSVRRPRRIAGLDRRGLRDVDVIADGTDEVTAAIETIGDDLAAVRESAGDDIRPEVDAVRARSTMSRPAVSEGGTDDLAGTADAVSTLVTATSDLFDELNAGPCAESAPATT